MYSHIDILNEMVKEKKVKSTKNIAAIFVGEAVQIWYMYGAWVIAEPEKEMRSGRSSSYESFLSMIAEKYPSEEFGEHKIIA
ncbi:MAG: hypothetical protein ACQEXV_05460 [Bacillota bacterium]|uniref:Uncharacterized protein n=1 Tax=Paenibacillus terrae TaxID=159743 RepID=A0A4U2Q478_9BACL|nr:hypothetical protein [Paenibacillus terrae]TKH44198.1 hypothetical protein C1I60_12765 [Paenibacillus terrae]